MLKYNKAHFFKFMIKEGFHKSSHKYMLKTVAIAIIMSLCIQTARCFLGRIVLWGACGVMNFIDGHAEL